jgi:hypothetical protein
MKASFQEESSGSKFSCPTSSMWTSHLVVTVGEELQHSELCTGFSNTFNED